MKRYPLVLAALAAVAIATGVSWLLHDSRRGWFAGAEMPTLADRYAEQWGVGVSGEPVALTEGRRLQATVGKTQMFTPAVCAPPSTTLSNVVLNVCLPFDLLPAVAPTAWQAQDADGCARYAVRFRLPVNRGTCGNPTEAMYFTPSVAGHHRIDVAIGSAELPEFTTYFVVEAK